MARLRNQFIASISVLILSACSQNFIIQEPVVITGYDPEFQIESTSLYEQPPGQFDQVEEKDVILVEDTVPEAAPAQIPTIKIIKPIYEEVSGSSEVIGLNGFPENVNPITGLEVSEPQNLLRRPVMIKVSNFPRSGRPHAGLSRADIVFEYYIGEEMNRFLAVFYGDNSNHVGPLRSGRLIDPQLVNLYGGILVYGSADPKVDVVIKRKLDDKAITHLTATCPPICGDDTHSVSGVFVDSGEITKFVQRKGMDNQVPDNFGTIFDPVPPEESYFGINIGVEYSIRNRGEWHYEAESGKYLRWIEEEAGSFGQIPMIPLVDRNNGQQISFSNVIVLFSTYIEYAPTLHDVLINANTHGQKALFFRDAVMVEGSWKIFDNNTPIQFYNQYGLPYALKPGNTWIIIAGVSSTMSQINEGNWEMQFKIP
ncbi:MAG: DUF3048 domain-containing protein [Anaerolineaceae bacterium]|nr:DUF3048 domain-containing protein [Anaerolineaceae bacterium]